MLELRTQPAGLKPSRVPSVRELMAWARIAEYARWQALPFWKRAIIGWLL